MHVIIEFEIGRWPNNELLPVLKSVGSSDMKFRTQVPFGVQVVCIYVTPPSIELTVNYTVFLSLSGVDCFQDGNYGYEFYDVFKHDSRANYETKSVALKQNRVGFASVNY